MLPLVSCILNSGMDCEMATGENEKNSKATNNTLLQLENFNGFNDGFIFYFPVFFKIINGGDFVQSTLCFIIGGPMEKLPKIISCFPSPFISPASIVSHRHNFVCGKENGWKSKLPLFSKYNVYFIVSVSG